MSNSKIITDYTRFSDEVFDSSIKGSKENAFFTFPK